jgi:tripartite-type tricarboxylate transporter receptor subunit TctC
MFRTLFVVAALLPGLTGTATAQSAADYPRYPVQIVINFPPGGPSDTTIRVIHEAFQQNLGGVLDLANRPGGGGVLGFALVAKAKPDGYTLVNAMASPLTVGAAVRNVGFSFADFEPIGAYASDMTVIFGQPDSRWKTMEEMLAYAKANPTQLKYASTGLGSTPWLVMEAVKVFRGVDIPPVHFVGTGPVRAAALGGHTDVATAVFGSIRDLVKAGKLQALAVSGKTREPGFPNIPTLEELGLGEASMDLWGGLWAPKGTPKPIVDKLGTALEKTVRDGAVAEKLAAAGYRVEWMPPATMLTLTRRDHEVALRIAKTLKIEKK